MHQKRFVLCSAAALLALAVACSKSSDTPVSPTAATETTSSAAADGSTLKATAPAPTSPVNGAQPDSLVLTANKAAGKFDTSPSFSYEFEVKTAAGAVVSACNATIAAGGAATVSYTPTCALEFDTAHTWRVRATYAGAAGPWSAAASFKTPSGGYMRGNEIFDPLTNGRTIGETRGPVQFSTGVGAKLVGHESHILYRLPTNLQAGEFSVMILGADEGTEGDKSKVFSMQEGPDEGDITDDDYRFTAELRGRNYASPGSVTFRIIAGDSISRDGARVRLDFDSSRWYFWRFSWQTGRATLEVRRDGPTGQTIYSSSVGTGTHPYRPDPHYVYLGAPAGRAGFMDATLPGGTYKNLWVSSRPRPAFPGE
jgi:hypothetical protein